MPSLVPFNDRFLPFSPFLTTLDAAPGRGVPRLGRVSARRRRVSLPRCTGHPLPLPRRALATGLHSIGAVLVQTAGIDRCRRLLPFHRGHSYGKPEVYEGGSLSSVSLACEDKRE